MTLAQVTSSGLLLVIIPPKWGEQNIAHLILQPFRETYKEHLIL